MRRNRWTFVPGVVGGAKASCKVCTSCCRNSCSGTVLSGGTRPLHTRVSAGTRRRKVVPLAVYHLDLSGSQMEDSKVFLAAWKFKVGFANNDFLCAAVGGVEEAVVSFILQRLKVED